MLKKYFLYTLAVVATLMTAGCADDLTVEPEGVMLQLEITDVSPGVSTRAVPADLPKPVQELFHLAIASDESGRTVYDDTFAPSVGPFAPGRFTLSVDCGDDVLALDAPRYAGSATASIYKGMENIISIEARVANALMSIAYQADGREELDEVFESYGVTFTLDDKEVSLNGPTPAQSAYFPAGSVPRVTFHAVRKDDGREVSTSLDAALAARLPLEAGQHAKVTLGVNADRVTITKVDIEEVTINQTIPPSWLPRPKATVSGFDADGTLRNVETNTTGEVKLDFTTSSALQDVELTLDIQDPGFAHLAGTHLLSQMSAEEIETLRTAGIELPTLGAEAGTITLTRFATNLQTDKGAETTNTLALRVKANDRWDTDAPANYQIIVEKPEFTISVDERNVWSKTLTADEANVSSGNAERILPKLRYQYSADGGATWQEFTDGKTLTFASHPSVKQYKLRAMYREGILSNTIDCTLESPVQLPNSGMDEWTDDNYKGSRYSFNPWLNKESCHWDTNNQWTTRHRVNSSAFIANYNGFCAVSYVPGRSGLAAELRNTANGRGNTNLWGITTTKTYNKVPGELFIGTMVVNNTGNDANGEGNWSRTKDGVFNDRPTGIRFWYKYAPMNSDSWKMEIQLLDANNQVIVEKTYTDAQTRSSWTEASVDFDYLSGQLYEKCKCIYVIFSSSVTSGDSMPWEIKTYTIYYDQGNKTLNYDNAYVGSILTIDDISLVYDK